jgi:hypothetical protein
MRDFYLTELAWSYGARSKRAYIDEGRNMWNFYLGPALTIPLFLFPWSLRDRRIRILVFISGIAIVGLALPIWTMPHYIAPYSALIFTLLLQSIRHLWFFKVRSREVGLFLTRSIPVLLVTLTLVRIFIEPFGLPVGRIEWNPWLPKLATAVDYRSQIINYLKQYEGKHLVIVRHNSDQSWHREWVYNQADIDAADIVWAREMNKDNNDALLEYFHDRQFWLGEPDLTPPKLSPYSTLNFP